MGLWQMLIEAFCGKPQKPGAGPEEVRQEQELLEEGKVCWALSLCEEFAFVATAERFNAWNAVARRHVRESDEAFDMTFLVRVIGLLQGMAIHLGDDAVWYQTARITLAGARRCCEGSALVYAAIRAAAQIVEEEKRVQCVVDIAESGVLQSPYCAIDYKRAEIIELFSYLEHGAGQKK